MKNIIINRPYEKISVPEFLLEMFPYRLSDSIKRELSNRDRCCEEIRVRCKRMSSLTLSGNENIPLDVSLSSEEMERIFENMCDKSLYAHIETINNGYISLKNSIRVGIAGKSTVENGKITGISDINGLCIRLPHYVKVNTEPIVKLIKESGFNKNILIYSPPGIGKTTVLRSIAAEMSKSENNVRTVVVDTRGELEFTLRSRSLLCDVLSGYPKAAGIEIAMRTLNAKVIICDEIGSEDDVSAISKVSNCGSTLIASAHANDIKGLLSKENIMALHKKGIFDVYVGLERENGEMKYNFTFAEEAVC